MMNVNNQILMISLFFYKIVESNTQIWEFFSIVLTCHFLVSAVRNTCSVMSRAEKKNQPMDKLTVLLTAAVEGEDV